MPAVAVLLAALAAVPSLELEWSAPQGCPDHAAVQEEAARALAMLPEVPAPQRARGVVSRVAEGFRLDLEVLGRGTRTFRDASCAGFAQVAGLALALAATPPAPTPVPPEPTPEAPPPRFLVRLLLSGDLGTLRSPTAGAGVAFGGFLGSTRLEGRAQYWLERSAGGVQDQLISVGVTGCQAISDGLEVGVCLGLEGGRLEARALETGESTRGAWIALEGGVALGVALPLGLAIRLEAGLGLTLISPNFETIAPDAQGPAALFGRGTLGLEWRFH